MKTKLIFIFICLLAAAVSTSAQTPLKYKYHFTSEENKAPYAEPNRVGTYRYIMPGQSGSVRTYTLCDENGNPKGTNPLVIKSNCVEDGYMFEYDQDALIFGNLIMYILPLDLSTLAVYSGDKTIAYELIK